MKLNINKPTKAGENIFFLAVGNSSVLEVVSLLRDREVDINCRNINGSTG
jgi:hypothetical protein